MPSALEIPTISDLALCTLKQFDVDVNNGLRGPYRHANTLVSLPVHTNAFSYTASLHALLDGGVSVPQNQVAQSFKSSDDSLSPNILTRCCWIDGMDHDVDVYFNLSQDLSQQDISFAMRDGYTIHSRGNSNLLALSVIKKAFGLIVEQGLIIPLKGREQRPQHSLGVKFKWDALENLLPSLLQKLKEANPRRPDYQKRLDLTPLPKNNTHLLSQRHLNIALIMSSILMMDEWSEIKYSIDGARLYMGEDFDNLEVSLNGVISIEAVNRSSHYLDNVLQTRSAPYIQVVRVDPETNRSHEVFRVYVSDEGLAIQQKTPKNCNFGILNRLKVIAYGVNHFTNQYLKPKQSSAKQ